MSGYTGGNDIQARIQFKILGAISMACAALVLGACTGSHGGGYGTTTGVSITQASSAGSAKASATPSAPTAPACTSDDLALFDRQDGEVVDLDRDSLPRGLFLATSAKLMIERKADSGATHVVIREAIGGKGAEIACADNVDGLGTDFDMVMTGLVKFDTSSALSGTGFVNRQFFFFQNTTGFGVVLSTPRSQNTGLDLKSRLRAGPASGQLVRLSERSYLLKYTRERDGVRALLQIRLDLIPQ